MAGRAAIAWRVHYLLEDIGGFTVAGEGALAAIAARLPGHADAATGTRTRRAAAAR